MLKDARHIAEAYTSQIPTQAQVQTQPGTMLPVGYKAPSEEQDKKVEERKSLKDWIRLPFIDTPFKARMAAVLIIELINTMSSTAEYRDLVLKEIKANNRLHRKR
jgi:hypothetical protein